MPCPHASGGSERDGDGGDSRLSRRNYLKAAVSIGGTSALAACLETEASSSDPEAPQFPRGPEDPDTLPDSQHAWQEYLVHDRFGNTIFPLHHSLVFFDYVGEGTPTAAEREQVEQGLRTIERAYQRGTGGSESARYHEGLLFTLGYSPTYFDRFEESLPDGLDLQRPEEVIEKVGGEASADHYDAAMHFASGNAAVVLGAEQALAGEVDEVNGLAVEGGFERVLERVERRTGFIGKGQPAKRYDHEEIPDSSPLSMGFKAGFADNLPREELATIQSGPFAGGTTQKVSRIENDLDHWYGDTNREERAELIFTPSHDREDIGEFGENLAGDTGKRQSHVEQLEEDAREKGRVGHGQKLAKARDEGFRPPLLRRDFDATGEPGLHFDSWQRGIEDFVKTRQAMNGEEFVDEVDADQNGILDYIEVTNRATFLIPPRDLRSLPTPSP